MKITDIITENRQGVREGQLDPYRLERLDPQSRRVLQRMADHKEPGSWLSASEAYAMMLGLQYKSRNPRGWEQEVQHYVDLWKEITGNKNLEEDWRKWVAGGAMTAAAMAPMAAQAQAYKRAPDATAALQTLRKDDSRIQQNQSTQQLAKVIYAQMVKERGQPMDSRQQKKWMAIAQEKAAAQIQQKQQPSTAAKNSRSNLIQPSEYRRSPMMDKDW